MYGSSRVPDRPRARTIGFGAGSGGTAGATARARRAAGFFASTRTFLLRPRAAVLSAPRARAAAVWGRRDPVFRGARARAAAVARAGFLGERRARIQCLLTGPGDAPILPCERSCPE